uniref:LRRCT domain-containing protein n=1 Tax=Steinernema glaseri TaxID=37863 RepID=A0A1I7YYU3_9BILA
MIIVQLPTLLIVAALFAGAQSQCLPHIKAPCSCTSTRYEPVSIVCDSAESLEDVLKALSQPPPFIDSLTISNTPIPQLPGQVFQGLAVKKLVLRNNALREIAKDAFDGVMTDYTQELEIRSNKLTEIPLNGISQLRSLHSLVLSDNEIYSIPTNIFLNYHSRAGLHRLDLSANNISFIPPEGFLGLENLQQLSLDKNRFTEIPSDALEILQTLEDLSMGVNAIKEIKENSLPLPKLKSLSLEVNEISAIAENAFEQIPELLYLYLSNNKFTKIDPSMFYYINNLKVLALSSNRISRIRRDDLQYIPSLVRLELADCFINNIEDGALQRIPKIQVIILTRNQLTRIHFSTFDTLSKLLSLDLRGNQINKVDDRAFAGLGHLRQLDLSENKIETLQKDTFKDSFLSSAANEPQHVYLNDNPWTCDSKLEWLQKWIARENVIQFATPQSAGVMCNLPERQRGKTLKAVSLVKEPKNVAPFKTMPKPNSIPPFKTSQYPQSTVETTRTPYNRSSEAPGIQYSAFTPLFIIIAISVSIVSIASAVILLVHCFIKHSEEKKRDDRRDLSGSLVSGFGSTFGTGPYAESSSYYRTHKNAYPMSLQMTTRPHMRDGTGLNNTMNWWCY